MTTCSSEIETASASKYLQQLCKHFAHKAPAEFDPHKGKVDFPIGVCTMEADDKALRVRCETDSSENARKMQAIIVSHLVKFAFRENLTINWVEG